MERVIKLTFIVIICLLVFIALNSVTLCYYADMLDKSLHDFVWKLNFGLCLFLAYVVYAFFNMLVEYRYPTEEDYEDFE